MATYFNGKEIGSSLFFTAKGEYFGESQADWNETDPTSLAYIKNKPDIELAKSTMTTIFERTAGNGTQNYTHDFGQYDLVLVLSRPKSTSEYIPTVLPVSIARYYVANGLTFTFQVADDGAYSKWGFGTNKIWYDSGNSGDIIGLYGIKFGQESGGASGGGTTTASLRNEVLYLTEE